ncbi:hypothetical protein BCY91_07520 [Pelobium manganitolerans]|uniref:Glycosyl transferase n=1 Tax=Pelobium manganitolerans TaxID=1842495 RepID=A0A419S3U7_9SPHI|nr:glycosyltransferase family 8 protein [Pelobium manganitolerans]RKD14327.1 hypothetical protein BCY91_07520 [Pelobium manganitolerans]
MIAITLASNNNYAILAAVLIQSVITNHTSGEDITFYFLDDGISRINREKINTLAKDNVKIEWKPTEEILPPGVKFPEDNSAFPRTSYFRMFAPFVVPPSVKKLIYFDVDMVVKADVAQLWNTDMRGHTMAAVQDVGKVAGCKWGGIPNYEELGIAADAPYFNSGMLLIDCEQWRKQNIPQKVLKVMEDNIQHVNYADQYGLNVVFTGKWLQIDPFWNWFANNYHPNAKCIHYLDIKPIYKSYNSDKVFQQEFFKYLAQTPWKNMKMKSDLSRLIHKAKIKLKKKFKAFLKTN